MTGHARWLTKDIKPHKCCFSKNLKYINNDEASMPISVIADSEKKCMKQ